MAPETKGVWDARRPPWRNGGRHAGGAAADARGLLGNGQNLTGSYPVCVGDAVVAAKPLRAGPGANPGPVWGVGASVGTRGQCRDSGSVWGVGASAGTRGQCRDPGSVWDRRGPVTRSMIGVHLQRTGRPRQGMLRAGRRASCRRMPGGRFVRNGVAVAGRCTVCGEAGEAGSGAEKRVTLHQ